MEQESTEPGKSSERWPLVRDVLVFQCKLLVDGFRDLVLLPVSLLVGIVSIIGKGKGKPPGHEFYDLMRAAQRTERWINLFGAADQRRAARPDADEASPPATQDLDALVARVEAFLVDEYRKGGVTAQAKGRLDAALNSLQQLRNSRDRAL